MSRGSTVSSVNNSARRFTTSDDSPGSSQNKSKSLYREAFADADIWITEGFLDIDPELHPSLKKLLFVRPCIRSEIKAEFPKDSIPNNLYYEQKPVDIHHRQEEAIRYLLTTRAEEMSNCKIAGRTEAAWAEFTKDKLFLPLLNPQGSMNKLMGDVTLKFPKKFEKMAKSLTAPKPDILFGAYINRASAKLNRRNSKDPGM